MKRILSFIISLALLISLFGNGNVYAKDNDQPTITVSNVICEAGESVEVSISIKNNPGILGTTMKVEYDNGLTLKAANAGDAFAALTMTKPGSYVSGCKFVWDGTDLIESDIKDGTILTLSFDVSSNASVNDIYNISVSCEDAIDYNINIVNVVSQNGYVTVKNEETEKILDRIAVTKSKTSYKVGEQLSLSDAIITAYYSDDTSREVSNYTTNVSEIDMTVVGEKTLTFSYSENGVVKTADVNILVEAVTSNIATISVGDYIAHPGEFMDVFVSIEDNPGILGMTLKLDYDSRMTLVSATNEETFSSLTMTKPGSFSSGCKFVWDGTDLEDQNIKDGNILKLSFRISDDAIGGDSYNINLSCEDAVDKDLNAVEIADISGHVNVENANVNKVLDRIIATKTKTAYMAGEQINIDDITVTAYYTDDSYEIIDKYSTNVSQINTSVAGNKSLVISYTEGSITEKAFITINVTENRVSADLAVINNNSKILPGDTINVSVTINDNPGILGLTLKLDYDSKLVLTNAENGSAFSALTMTKPGEFVSGSKFVWDGTELSADEIKNGSIINLTFVVSEEAKETDKLFINVSCEDAINNNMLPVDFEITNGSIDISNELKSITSSKTKTNFETGEEINTDDLTVTAFYADKSSIIVNDYTTNASSIDMTTPGKKVLTISYSEEGIIKQSSIELTVKEVIVSRNTQFIVDTNTAFPGDEIDVCISVSENPGILGATLKLQYSDKLTLKSAKCGDAFEMLTMTKPGEYSTGCKFVWDGTDLDDEDIKDGKILILTFEVSDGAIAKENLPISILCDDVINKDLSTVNAIIQNGYITVGDNEIIVNDELESIDASKVRTEYEVGDTLNLDDITVNAYYKGGLSKKVIDYTLNTSSINMNEAGTKNLIVSYTEGGITRSTSIIVLVSKKNTSQEENDQKVANEVANLINNIPDISDITLDDKENIETIKAIYDKMTDSQKSKINSDTVNKLIKASEKITKLIETEKKAKELSERKANYEKEKKLQKDVVDSLLKEDDSESCKKLVKDAKAAIDSLSFDETKSLDDNKFAIKEIIAKLKNALEKQRKVDKQNLSGGSANKDNGNNSSSSNQNPKYSNEWIDGKWYGEDGTCTYAGTLSWKSNATGWWVEDSAGWYPQNQWQKIDGIWYFFKPDGYMASGEYYNGYWLNSDGSWDDQYELSWKSNSTGWWVEDKSGWWPSNSWLKIDGYWYYFKADGYMATSQYVDGYWINASGVCE